MNWRNLINQIGYWLYNMTGGEPIPTKPPLLDHVERRIVTGVELYQIIRDKFPEGNIYLSDP